MGRLEQSIHKISHKHTENIFNFISDWLVKIVYILLQYKATFILAINSPQNFSAILMKEGGGSKKNN